MSSRYSMDLMVNVAHMYYTQGLKQEEIAKRVSVSRSSISLILSEAKEWGVVDIRIRDPRENNVSMAREFESRFGLKQCIVLPTKVREPDYLMHMVAQRAVSVFNEVIRTSDTVGIAWGRTCYEFMHQCTECLAESGQVKVVPLVGSSNRSIKVYQMNEVVRQFADKVRGKAHFIHAPVFPPDMKDFLLYWDSASMNVIKSLWDRMDIAIVSIGAPPAQYADSVAEIIENGTTEAEAIRERAVGDICARFFDMEGNFIEDDIFKSTIAVPVESLRKAKTCICVVTGEQKTTSIIGGLRTKLIDILVTDEGTAGRVLATLDA